jgi:hypothetical protein
MQSEQRYNCKYAPMKTQQNYLITKINTYTLYQYKDWNGNRKNIIHSKINIHNTKL